MGRCEIISVGREWVSVQERERERQRQRGEDMGLMKEGKEGQGPCYFPDKRGELSFLIFINDVIRLPCLSSG